MRLAVFIFSFYLVFGQIYYAHSAFPLLGGAVATARGVGTLVKAGKIIKGGAIWGGGALYLWCKANKAKCKDLAGDTAELILGDDDDDNRVYCSYRIAPYFNKLHTDNKTYDKQSAYDTLVDELNSFYPYNEYKHHNDKYNDVLDNAIKSHNKKISEGNQKSTDNQFIRVGTFIAPVFYRQKTNVNAVYQEQRYTFYLYANCSDDINALSKEETDEQQKKREKELWDKLKDKLSDDDITNIVNNYGDDIDIDKYCASGATCYFIDSDFEKEVNNNDYDIDKIDDKNCNTRNGKIVSCPNAKKKKSDDDDGETNKDDKKDKDDDKSSRPSSPSGKSDDDDPIFCKTSDITKEICEYLDWVDDEPKDPKDEEVKVKKDEHKDTLDDDVIDVNKGCPSDLNITYNMFGRDYSLNFSYRPLCSFADDIEPYINTAGAMVAFYIITGTRRD